MNVDLIGYLSNMASKLKENLPNNEIFDRDVVFSNFEEALSKAFSEFEVLAFEDAKTVIIAKENISYRVLVTFENNQIKVSALPHNNKQTQLDSTEPIIVATEAYDELEYEKMLLAEQTKTEFAKSFVLFMLRQTDEHLIRRGDKFDSKCIVAITEQVIPEALLDQIMCHINELTYEEGKNSFKIHLTPEKLINIKLKNTSGNAKKIHYSYYMDTSEGIVHVRCTQKVNMGLDPDPYVSFNARKYIVKPTWSTMRIRLYDQDAVDTLSQISGKNFMEKPNGFLKHAKHYCFKPDQELKVQKSQILLNDEIIGDRNESTLADIIPETFKQGTIFDHLVELTVPSIKKEEKNVFQRIFQRKSKSSAPIREVN